MKKLIAIALLTASTATHASYELCSSYAKLLYSVTDQKNKGVTARQMLEQAQAAFADNPELRTVVLSDIARVYKVKGYIAPEEVENEALLNCLKGD